MTQLMENSNYRESYRRYLIFGGTGFLGRSITMMLACNPDVSITLYSRHSSAPFAAGLDNVDVVSGDFMQEKRFDDLLEGVDVVFHLVSPTNVSNTNRNIGNELSEPVRATCNLLDACVRMHVKKVVFLSSGGAVYGASGLPPYAENDTCKPLSAYGMQKLMIEQVFGLYQRVSGLDYRVIRVSNPYGPQQDPDGQIGMVTKTIWKALCGDEIVLFGDGAVVRDFVYIDDVLAGIVNILNYDGEHRVFNLGSGVGTSIMDLLVKVESVLGLKLQIRQIPGRVADVPKVWLDMSRYRNAFGKFEPTSLDCGIEMTASHFRRVAEKG